MSFFKRLLQFFLSLFGNKKPTKPEVPKEGPDPDVVLEEVPGSVSTGSTNTKCAITNNSSSDVVVIIPVLSQSIPGPGSTNVYDQNLQILATDEGGQVIKQGKVGTVTLDQTYKDPTTGKTKVSKLYELLISKSTTYFPVANLGVMADVLPPHAFPPQTATAATEASLAQASVFVQTISAYPTSKLAKGYEAALKGAQTAGDSAADGSTGSSDKVANNINGATDAFFKGTKGYKNVALSDVVAVQSYFNRFPFIWNIAASPSTPTAKTIYYLYSTDGTAKKVTFVGTITLAPPGTIDLSKVNGGYTCTFSPAVTPTDTTKTDVDSTKDKTLTYTSGLFVDDPTVDVPGIAVRGTFLLKRFLTRVSTDTTILPVLTGTIDGATCLGFTEPQTSGSNGSSFWSGFFDFSTAKGIFNAVLSIGGAIMLLHFIGSSIYGIVKWARSRGAADEPTTKQLLDQQKADLEKTMNDKFEELYEKMNPDGGPPPADVDAAADAVDAGSAEVEVARDTNSVNEGLEEEAGVLEKIDADVGTVLTDAQTTSLEASATELSNISDSISSASPADLPAVVGKARVDLGTTSADISKLTDELDSSLSDAAKTSIESSQAAAAEASKTIDEAESDAAATATDDDPTVEGTLEDL